MCSGAGPTRSVGQLAHQLKLWPIPPELTTTAGAQLEGVDDLARDLCPRGRSRREDPTAYADARAVPDDELVDLVAEREAGPGRRPPRPRPAPGRRGPPRGQCPRSGGEARDGVAVALAEPSPPPAQPTKVKDFRPEPVQGSRASRPPGEVDAARAHRLPQWSPPRSGPGSSGSKPSRSKAGRPLPVLPGQLGGVLNAHPALLGESTKKSRRATRNPRAAGLARFSWSTSTRLPAGRLVESPRARPGWLPRRRVRREAGAPAFSVAPRSRGAGLHIGGWPLSRSSGCGCRGVGGATTCWDLLG